MRSPLASVDQDVAVGRQLGNGLDWLMSCELAVNAHHQTPTRTQYAVTLRGTGQRGNVFATALALTIPKRNC